jgi:hypothetical protein
LTEEWKDRKKDEETDMAKLIISFRNFANVPKMGGACGKCGFGGEALQNKRQLGKCRGR